MPTDTPNITIVIPTAEDVLDVDQVADILGYCADTVYDMAKANTIEHARSGKRIWFKRRWISDFLDANSQGGPDSEPALVGAETVDDILSNLGHDARENR